MRKVAITAGVAVLSLVVAAPAIAAGTSTASTNLATVTVSMGDIAFDGSECARLPVPITFTKTGGPADSVSMDVELEMRQPGSSMAEMGSDYIGLTEPASGTSNELAFTICPSSYNPAAGNYTVTGTLRTEFDFSRATTAPFSSFEVGAIQNQTSMSAIRIKKSAFDLSVSGTATAATVTKGKVGAGGDIVIRIKKPGSKKWVSGTTTYADSFGEWSASLGPQKKGTQIQAVLTNCRWCTDATSRIARTK